MAASLLVQRAPKPAIGNFIAGHGLYLFKKISRNLSRPHGFPSLPPGFPPILHHRKRHIVAFPMASSRKRATAAPTTPSTAAVSSSPPPSEQPTVVGTPCLSDNDAADAGSLAVRAPNVADVLKSVRLDNTVTQHFASADGVITSNDEDVFFEGGDGAVGRGG